jgi:hypothetical protein
VAATPIAGSVKLRVHAQGSYVPPKHKSGVRFLMDAPYFCGLGIVVVR